MNNLPVQDADVLDSLMGRIADEFLERLHRGEHPPIAEYADRYPHLADVIRQVLPALEAMRLSPSQTAGASDLPLSEQPLTGCLGDYRILRSIGRGGMGIVYEAEQISLGRRVALKVLPFAGTLDPKRLQRFKQEAQAAAHLQHQHIVPVYAVGCERGVHYYAMQFIEGQSLAVLIQELRQPSGRAAVHAPGSARAAGSPADPQLTGFSTLSAPAPEPPPAEAATPLAAWSTQRSTAAPAFFRTVARLGMQAAEALEHAHQMGVVHRDIKPANLLLDGRGNLWVTDFGLAHVPSDTQLTLTGDLVGTLRYMSPEQALAKRSLIDHRTDVYALGVTLYELLTLEPAFSGRDREELLRQIAWEEPRALHHGNPAVPLELETIILKAMAKHPDERYASAQELADDLGRFLKDEPIRARRPTRLQRAKKWARRHRGVVLTAGVATAVLVLLALGVLGVSYAYIKHERDQKEAAFQEKAQALDRAEKNLELARKAVDEIYERLADRAASTPQMQPLQREFLLQALQFYQEFAEQKGTDPQIRFGVAHAYQRVGAIKANLNQPSQAIEALTHAITLLRDLVAEYPSEPRFQYELAYAHSILAGTRLALDEALAERDCRQAIALLTTLATDYPRETQYRLSLAKAQKNLGWMLRTQSDEAEAAHRRAIAICTRLVADFPEALSYREELAECQRFLGRTLAVIGRHQEAERAYREGLAVLQGTPGRLNGLPPAPLGATYYLLAHSLQALGRPREAAEAYRKAIPIHEQYVVAFPHNSGHWIALYGCYRSLIRLQKQAGPAQAEEDLLRKALDFYEPFLAELAELPGATDYHEMALRIAINLGGLLKEGGERRERVPEYRRMLDLAEKLAARFPAQVSFRSLAGFWQASLGSLLTAIGRTEEAETAYRQAVTHYRAALELDPKRAVVLNNWAWLLSTCPDGRFRDAPHAVALARQAVELAPQRGDYWNTLGVAQYRAGDWKAAIAALEKSKALFASRYNEPDNLESFCTFFLALAHGQLGDAETAHQEYDRAVGWMERNEPRDEELLRFRAEAAALLGRSPQKPDG